MVVSESDVEKAYPRIQLVEQIKILGLGQPERPVDTARIMRSGNAQRRHWSTIGNSCIQELL